VFVLYEHNKRLREVLRGVNVVDIPEARQKF